MDKAGNDLGYVAVSFAHKVMEMSSFVKDLSFSRRTRSVVFYCLSVATQKYHDESCRRNLVMVQNGGKTQSARYLHSMHLLLRILHSRP
jgi:hypothetical protein